MASLETATLHREQKYEHLQQISEDVDSYHRDKNAAPRAAWLSCELRLDGLDIVNQKFSISGWINVFWRDENFDKVYQKINKIDDAFQWMKHYTFPMICNQIFTAPSIKCINHNDDPILNYHKKLHIVHIQYYVSADVLEHFELFAFPFDYQFLNLKLRWNVYSYKLLREYPAWMEELYPTSKCSDTNDNYNYHIPLEIALKEALVSEYELLSAWIDFRTSHNLTYSLIKIRIKRNPWYHILNITFPFFIIVSCGFSVFGIDKYNIGDRLAVGVTILLTFAAFQSTIANELPKTSEILFIDIYVSIAYVILAALIIENSIVGNIGTDIIAEDIDIITFVVLGIIWLILSLYYVSQYCRKPKWVQRSKQELIDWDKTNNAKIKYVDKQQFLVDDESVYKE